MPELSRTELQALLAEWGHAAAPEAIEGALQALGWAAKTGFTVPEVAELGGALTEAAMLRLNALPPSTEGEHLKALFGAIQAHALPLAKQP